MFSQSLVRMWTLHLPVGGVFGIFGLRHFRRQRLSQYFRRIQANSTTDSHFQWQLQPSTTGYFNIHAELYVRAIYHEQLQRSAWF